MSFLFCYNNHINVLGELYMVTLHVAVVATDDGRSYECQLQGDVAGSMLCELEKLRSQRCEPFSWLFVRPPWAADQDCCKRYAFNYMRKRRVTQV